MIDRELDNLLADDMIDVAHQPRLLVFKTRDRLVLARLLQAPPLGRSVSPRLPHHPARPETRVPRRCACHRQMILPSVYADPLAATLRDRNIHCHGDERVPETPA